MRVISLASGSSGNCYLVQAGGNNVLIDCGLTATNLKKYLADYGVRPAELSAIFLTHEHGDHVRGAGTVSRQWGVPIIANEKTLTAARYRWQKMERLEEQRAVQFGEAATAKGRYNTEILPVGEARSFGSLEVSSFPVSHDASQTVCYTFRAEGQQGVILTDLGCATTEIFEPLNASQLIVLEANHDLPTLRNNPKYPASLKARISSNVGHLSNEQSVTILQKVLEESGLLRMVWLAHLSEANNSPDTAQRFMNKWLDRAGLSRFNLQIAKRDKPSLRWDSQAVFYQTQMF